MKLHDSLTGEQQLLPEGKITLYSCGPTVYDHAHIGNLRTFIMDDLLRRSLKSSGSDFKAVMNITDIDDKTIAKSLQEFPELKPKEALRESTRNYEAIFMEDLRSVGVDTSLVTFVRATDRIPVMQNMIRSIVEAGFGYVSDGSIYFDLKQYRQAGHTYGRLVNVDYNAQARVDNDDYDKQSAQDFVLWKAAKAGEPSWDFELEGQNLPGRPGWHIECSAMALDELDTQPVSIHSGGIDLKFPHHENEIAQVVAATGKQFCDVFVHHHHLYVDGHKMSKSLQNFYTVSDIAAKGHSPLAFRLLVLQAHHESDLNFTWESLEAAQNTLINLMAWADLKFQQNLNPIRLGNSEINDLAAALTTDLANNLDSSQALAKLFQFTLLRTTPGMTLDEEDFEEILAHLEQIFGLGFTHRHPISEADLALVREREAARSNKDYTLGDTIRTKLRKRNIDVDDTPNGSRWRRTSL